MGVQNQLWSPPTEDSLFLVAQSSADRGATDLSILAEECALTHSEKVNCDQTYCIINKTWRAAQLLLNRDYLNYWPTLFVCGLVISFCCTFLKEMSRCES